MNNYSRLARNMALKSPSRFRLGAVFVKKKKIISTGFNNMRRTHPAMAKLTDRPVGLHAEVHACLGVPVNDLEGSTVYIYRILKNGNPALAKPCKLCQTFLASVGAKEAIFSTGEGFGSIQFA